MGKCMLGIQHVDLSLNPTPYIKSQAWGHSAIIPTLGTGDLGPQRPASVIRWRTGKVAKQLHGLT